MSSRPIGHSTNEQASFVHLARMDLATILECFDEDIPVLFKAFDDLEKYCIERRLSVQKIPGICCSEAVITAGDFNGRIRHFVDFVWVRAASKRYRDAVKNKWTLRDPNRVFPSKLHVDHIVNRGSLKDFHNAGFNPWVMLFEVPWSANVGFGSNVERGRSQVATSESRFNLTGLLLYKLYATDFPKTRDDFESTIKNIRGQLKSEKWLKRVEDEVSPFMQTKA